ncbi:MAG: hypothetical protein IJS63_09745 [Bacteroidaceae bacterium]|nr:hypothetical protein [Bacteroidaceae bacterium]
MKTHPIEKIILARYCSTPSPRSTIPIVRLVLRVDTIVVERSASGSTYTPLCQYPVRNKEGCTKRYEGNA